MRHDGICIANGICIAIAYGNGRVRQARSAARFGQPLKARGLVPHLGQRSRQWLAAFGCDDAALAALLAGGAGPG